MSIFESIKRNFENLKTLLLEWEFVFNIKNIPETWCPNSEVQYNSNLSLTEFNSVLYEKSKKRRGGEVLIFTKKNLSCKIRKDLSESEKHKEILFQKISNKTSTDILLSCCYKPPKGDINIWSIFLKPVYYLLGDLYINCLEYSGNEHVATFHCLLLDYGAMNNSTQRKSATTIVNAITTCILSKFLKKDIIKSGPSDNLPIFFSIGTSKLLQNTSPLKIKKNHF